MYKVFACKDKLFSIYYVHRNQKENKLPKELESPSTYRHYLEDELTKILECEFFEKNPPNKPTDPYPSYPDEAYKKKLAEWEKEKVELNKNFDIRYHYRNAREFALQMKRDLTDFIAVLTEELIK